MQLLPWPFCGKEPEIDKYKLRGVMVWNIWCPNDECFVTVETDDFKSEAKAITLWNTRVSPDA